MQDQSIEREFPLREAHELVSDLMAPKQWIYWIDFLFHTGLGWIAFVAAARAIVFGHPACSLYSRCAGTLPRGAFYVQVRKILSS